MLSNTFKISMCVGLLLGVSGQPLFAEDDAAATASAEATAAVTQVVQPPELKPITISFPGIITDLHAAAAQPTITVQDRYGVDKRMYVKDKTKITDGQASLKLSNLQKGQSVTVEYVYDVISGERSAESITVQSQT